MGMMTRMMSPLTRPFRRAVAGLACAALMTSATACTGSDDPEPAASGAPSASTGAAATLDAKPVPLDIRVAQVPGGKMKKSSAKVLENQIGRTVSEYFDGAFFEGDYPRSDFSDAFTPFSSGAARRARADRELLTNASLGDTIEAVVPKRKWVRLSVLLPKRTVAGVTARVRLVFVVERGDEGVDQKVTVTGRLVLSRAKSGKWEIFGYDLARSAVPAEKGGM